MDDPKLVFVLVYDHRNESIEITVERRNLDTQNLEDTKIWMGFCPA